MIIPSDLCIPLKVLSVDCQDGNPCPLWLYTMKMDYGQGSHILNEAGADQGDPHRGPSGWIIFREIQFATETPLPIGVGDMFTVDLQPFEPVKLDLQTELAARIVRKLLG